MFLTVSLFALFATVFTIGKEALHHASPFFLVGFRMFIAGILMIGIAFARNPKALVIPKKAWGTVLLLALTNIYLTNVFEFWGLKYLTSFKTCFLYSLSPFLSALFSYLILNETMSLKKWIGFTIGFLGFVPILLHQTSSEVGGGTIGSFSLPELSVLLAVVASSVGWIMLRSLVGKHEISSFIANGYSMLIGGVFALLHSAAIEPWNPVPVTDMQPFLLCSLALIIISNGICYNLAGHILKRFSATFMSFVGLTTPLFTALFGAIFHNETTPLSFWISYSIVLLGLVVFYQEEMQQRKNLAPTTV